MSSPSWAPISVAALALSAFAGCPEPPGTPCNSNADCRQIERCENGSCVRLVALAPDGGPGGDAGPGPQDGGPERDAGPEPDAGPDPVVVGCPPPFQLRGEATKLCGTTGPVAGGALQSADGRTRLRHAPRAGAAVDGAVLRGAATTLR
jgi:hypothetical protein